METPIAVHIQYGLMTEVSHFYSFASLGWHHRLNNRTRVSGMNMYQLIQVLYDESGIVNIQMRLVSEKSWQKGKNVNIQQLKDEFSVCGSNTSMGQ